MRRMLPTPKPPEHGPDRHDRDPQRQGADDLEHEDPIPRHLDEHRRHRRRRLLGHGDERQDRPADEQPEARPGDEADDHDAAVLQPERAEQLASGQAQGAQERELGPALARRNRSADGQSDDREQAGDHEPEGQGADDPERHRVRAQAAGPLRDADHRGALERLSAKGRGDGLVGAVGSGNPPLVGWSDGGRPMEPQQAEGRLVEDQQRPFRVRAREALDDPGDREALEPALDRRGDELTHLRRRGPEERAICDDRDGLGRQPQRRGQERDPGRWDAGRAEEAAEPPAP